MVVDLWPLAPKGVHQLVKDIRADNLVEGTPIQRCFNPVSTLINANLDADSCHLTPINAISTLVTGTKEKADHVILAEYSQAIMNKNVKELRATTKKKLN